MRRVALAVAVIGFSSLLAGPGQPARTADAAGGSHPFFSDNGTLVWYRSLPEAQAAARATNRLIFIESGRLECGQCRNLISRILPQEPIRSRISGIALGFADDCDDQGSPVLGLLSQNLPGATMLPLCGFVTSDLRWVTGWYGGTTPGAVMQHLAIAEDRCRRLQPARVAPTPPPAPTDGGGCAVPTPAPRPAPPAPPVPVTPFVMPRPTPVPTPTPPVRPTPMPVAPAPFVGGGTSPMPTPFVGGGTTPAPTPFVGPAPAPTPAPKPPAPKAPLVPLPTPMASPTPPVQPPAPPPTTRPPSTIERARAAAVREAWGEVLRINEGPGRGLPPTEAVELAKLVDRANQWVARSLGDAERYAGERHPADAARVLDQVARELEGTMHPATVDAARGQDAMRVLTMIEKGAADGARAAAATDGGPSADTLRRDAYSRFRGSRWAPLFRSR
jgi:hypothetical protein